jgi:hypothetical protein
VGYDLENEPRRLQATTYQANETVSMEGMVTWKHIKLPREQQFRAMRTLFIRVNGNKPVFKHGDVLFDSISGPRCVIHFCLQSVDLCRVAFKRVRNFFFEIIDDHKVREEGQDILDFEEIRVLQKSHRPDIFNE